MYVNVVIYGSGYNEAPCEIIVATTGSLIRYISTQVTKRRSQTFLFCSTSWVTVVNQL